MTTAEVARTAHEWCPECSGTGLVGVGPEGIVYDCPNLDVHRALERICGNALPEKGES